MFPPTVRSPWRRALAAKLIHRAWTWIGLVGAAGPSDEVGRRFRRFGVGSCLAFPPGPLVGERWIVIGEATLVGPNVSLAAGLPGEAIDPDAPPIVRIGDRCNIGRGSSINGRVGIVIEDDVTTAPNVYVTDHNHRYDDLALPIARQWVNEAPVRIGAGSWLATNVVVLPGADIGRHVTVAAGSVVRGTIPDNCVIAGAPARVVRRHVEGQGWVPELEPFSTPQPEDWPTSRDG